MPERAKIPRANFSRRFKAERSSISCFEVTPSPQMWQRGEPETLQRDDLDLGEWEANSVQSLE